jgi:HEAT repeat protein
MTADAAFQFIVDQLQDGDPIIRADAARLLGEIKRSDAVAPLTGYLQNEQHYTKVAGIYALWQIADPAAIPILQTLLKKPNVPDDWYWYARRAVVTSVAIGLSTFGDDSGVPFLQDLLDKNNDVVFCWYGPTILRFARESDQAKPVVGLQELAKQITVSALYNTVALSKRFSEPGLLTMTAETLGLIGTKDAQAKLVDLLTHASRYIRSRAALSLLEADASDANRQHVSNLLQSDQTDFVAIKASLALAKAFVDEREKRSNVIAKIAASATDAFDRAVAIESLGSLPGAVHADVIASALDDADAYVRQCAAEACPDNPELRKRIKTLQQSDPAPRVRLSASKWLATAGRQHEVNR